VAAHVKRAATVALNKMTCELQIKPGVRRAMRARCVKFVASMKDFWRLVKSVQGRFYCGVCGNDVHHAKQGDDAAAFTRRQEQPNACIKIKKHLRIY
jgi:hypothetical protein